MRYPRAATLTPLRLRDLGVTPPDGGQGDAPRTVLADPEGTACRMLEPREIYRCTGPGSPS
ncbi:hypothetical protein [Streptomyces werraensis]|uniref:hypothetical protein n=1 Tax=Streptomyces werraensis TaxID=68284 RepID=UPI003F4D96D8